MGLFNIVYNNLPSSLIPGRLRQPIQKGWLKALINGAVVPLYNTFFTNRSGNLYYLGRNSQVCYLEAVLNDTFDNTSRRIFIADMYVADPVYVYLGTEGIINYLALGSESGTTTYASPANLFTGAEVAASLRGFIVNVPTAITSASTYSLPHLKSLVDKYRLPGYGGYFVLPF